MTKRRPSPVLDDSGTPRRPRAASSTRTIARCDPGAETLPPPSERGTETGPASGPSRRGDARSEADSAARLAVGMRQAFVANEHDAALAAAERVLALDPENEEARDIATRCREAVEEVMVALLGGRLTTFDVVALGLLASALKSDRRTAVLTVLIKSGFNLGEILEMCGERRLDALRVLDELIRNDTVRRR